MFRVKDVWGKRVKDDAQVSGLGSQVDSSTFTEIKHIEERPSAME